MAVVGAGIGIDRAGPRALAHRFAVRRPDVEVSDGRSHAGSASRAEGPRVRAAARVFPRRARGIDDDIAGMATMSALLHHAFGHLWTGFYRVVGRRTCCASDRIRERSAVSTSRLGAACAELPPRSDARCRSRRRAFSRTHHVRCALEVGDRRAGLRSRAATLIAVLDIDSETSRRVRSTGCARASSASCAGSPGTVAVDAHGRLGIAWCSCP